jgi:anti-sigma-K factor RskA
MNNREHISDENLTQYALSMLPVTEMSSLKAHFLLCTECREALRKKSLALAAYGAATPQAFPPAGSRDRFLDQITSTEQITQTRKTNPSDNPVVRLLVPSLKWLASHWLDVTAIALAIALLVVSISYIRVLTQLKNFNSQAHEGQMDSVRMNELMELLTSVKVQHALLSDSQLPSPVPPLGQVIYSPEHDTLYFSGSNIRPLPAGKTYELWILQGKQQPAIPAGSFTPDINGYATLIPPRLPDNLNVIGYGVTVEDVMGLTTPTLPYIISTEQK